MFIYTRKDETIQISTADSDGFTSIVAEFRPYAERISDNEINASNQFSMASAIVMAGVGLEDGGKKIAAPAFISDIQSRREKNEQALVEMTEMAALLVNILNGSMKGESANTPDMLKKYTFTSRNVTHTNYLTPGLSAQYPDVRGMCPPNLKFNIITVGKKTGDNSYQSFCEFYIDESTPKRVETAGKITDAVKQLNSVFNQQLTQELTQNLERIARHRPASPAPK